MSDVELKSFGPFAIKSEDRGEVEAIVATLGVVDKDGDVILPGAVGPLGARVKLSGYDHDVITKGAPPAGKGVITEEGDKLVFRGKFFMSTDHGRNAFHTTKELGEEGEWSFGFPKNVKTAQVTDEWRAKGAKRMIAELKAIEASPVFVGAGWGTQTVAVKSEADVAEADAALALEAVTEVPAEPVVEPEAPAEPTAEEQAATAAEAEAEAKQLAEAAALKAARDEAVEEYHRVQRALQRMGYPA